MCVSGRGWCDKGLGRENVEYEQSSEVQQGRRHLYCGESGRLLPVLPGEFMLGFVVLCLNSTLDSVISEDEPKMCILARFVCHKRAMKLQKH